MSHVNIPLAPLVAVLWPFSFQAAVSRSNGEIYGGDPTGYGVGVRCIASSPFQDRWRQCSDPWWPTNHNPHLVLPDGTVMPPPDGLRRSLV